MRLLVLGGTDFVGRAVAEDAVSRGWQVTQFNRGTKRAREGTEVRVGDRGAPDGGLGALADGVWDAVVDTWKGAPSAVRDAARLLAGRAERYAYISSRSVYTFPPAAGADESAPLVEGSADAEATQYAEDKRGGELAVEAAFGARALLVRAGLILGPYENVGRLPWWLRRIARGGPVLAPGPRELALQYVDARDLAGWTLDAVERGLGGPYDIVSPPGHTTMGELLRTCVTVTGSDAQLRWTSPETIEAAGIQPWTELPVWLPPGALHDGLHRSDVTKALTAGLRCRPVTETVADTWTWLNETPGWAPPRVVDGSVGLPPEAEAKLLGG